MSKSSSSAGDSERGNELWQGVPKSIKKLKMSESSSSAGDSESGNELWQGVQTDILMNIASRLTSTDHAALRSSCKSWRAIFSATRLSHRPHPLPFLLLPPRYAFPNPLRLSNRTPPDPRPLHDYPLGPVVPFPRLDHGHTDSPFFPLDSLRNPTFHPLPSLSDTARHICIGSSHGWLILLDCNTHISLVNPLTAATIHLAAPLSLVCDLASMFDDYIIDCFVLFQVYPPRNLGHLAAIIRIAALSADPTDDPSFLLVIVLANTITSHFITCGPSDGYTTWQSHSHTGFPAYSVDDLIFHHGLCLASITWRRAGNLMFGPVDKIAIFNFHADPAFQRFHSIWIGENYAAESYNNFLIESAGELLLISRRGETTAGQISVYRLPPFEVQFSLILTTLDSIGDRALCLGTGNTVAVHAPDFPQSVRRNSIYFTDVYLKVVNNQFISVGCVYVFDMEQGVTTKAFEVAETDEENMWTNLRPWWVTPNLHRRDP